MIAPFRSGLAAAGLLALIAGAAQAQTITLTMPEDLCRAGGLPESAIRQIRARSDFSGLVAYAARECPEVAVLLTEAATAMTPPEEAESGNGTPGGTTPPVDGEEEGHGGGHGGSDGSGGPGGQGGGGHGGGGSGGQGGSGGGGGHDGGSGGGGDDHDHG